MGGEQAAKVMSIIAEDGARRAGQEPDHEALARQSKQIVDLYDKDRRLCSRPRGSGTMV